MPHRKILSLKMILLFVLFLTIGLIITKTINMEIPLETGIIGTMYTLFYSLFINSIFKFLDEKFINFRICLGDLIGKSQAVYEQALLSGNQKYIKRMREELISFIKSFNEIKATKYYLNQYHINKLYDATKELKIKNKKNDCEYSRTLALLGDLSATREKLEIFGTKQITRETKWIFISTTIIYLIVIAFLTFTTSSIYMNVIGILLIIMVMFVTIMMFNMDDLTHGTYYIKDKNIDELVELFEDKIQTEADEKKD
jgi:hypothetical protein